MDLTWSLKHLFSTELTRIKFMIFILLMATMKNKFCTEWLLMLSVMFPLSLNQASFSQKEPISRNKCLILSNKRSSIKLGTKLSSSNSDRLTCLTNLKTKSSRLRSKDKTSWLPMHKLTEIKSCSIPPLKSPNLLNRPLLLVPVVKQTKSPMTHLLNPLPLRPSWKTRLQPSKTLRRNSDLMLLTTHPYLTSSQTTWSKTTPRDQFTLH